MKIVTLSPEQFDKYGATHRYRNYYQTSAYGNTMIKFGFNVHYLGIADESNTLIGATLIIYKEVFLSNKIAYAPRGILFDYTDVNRLKELTDKLKQVLGKQGFMLLKIDPYIPITIRDPKGNIMNFNNQANIILSNLKSTGFQYKGPNLFFENEKPRWETVLTLNKDIREIFKSFEKRVRHKIRKATASGIEIYKDEENDISKIYEFIKNKNPKPIEFYKELADNFKENFHIYYAKLNTETYVINSRRSYEREMERNDILAKKIQNNELSNVERDSLLNNKMESDKLLNTYKNNLIFATELLKNNPEGLIVGGSINIIYDNAAYMFIEGFNHKYSILNPSYLIKWRMIDDYNKLNYKYINLNAVVGEFERKNKYSGLNEMKLGFNSLITEYIGEFDIILNNFTYNLYKGFNKNK